MNVPLTTLERGAVARVVAFDGGEHAQRRLRSLGVTPGRVVRKVSSLVAGGPLVIEIDRAQVAIGRGMASRILVEPMYVYQREAAGGAP